MKSFGSTDKDFIGAERVSRRTQNGVEIFERETKRLVLPACRQEREEKPVSSTRLIVDETISRSKDFIAKRRSELNEVDSLLRNLMRHTADAK